MEEQTQPTSQPTETNVSSQPVTPSAAANKGKTSLLAAVLIVLLILLGVGFILLKPTETPTPVANNSASKVATRSSTPSATASATNSSNSR